MDYVLNMDSSIFHFVEPGSPGGNYREMLRKGRKVSHLRMFLMDTTIGFSGRYSVWTFLAAR
jgi:hypothetical protein